MVCCVDEHLCISNLFSLELSAYLYTVKLQKEMITLSQTYAPCIAASSANNTNVALTMYISTCHRRFAQAFPTSNKSSWTVTDHLFNDLIALWFCPSQYYTIKGNNSKVDSSLKKLCGIKHRKTTPYYHQGNGQTEQFNQMLLRMLRTLPEEI